MIRSFSLASLGSLLCATACLGTVKFFNDIIAFSPDGEWKVTAISPDNQRPNDSFDFGFQSNFVYSAFNDRGTKLVWTRKQAAQEPEEYSPVRVVVANDGWVAIHTNWDRLVFVDPAGRNRGRVDDLKEQWPEADLKRYAIGSTVGLIWDPKSLWYFLNAERQRLFVVRAWWGRRIVIDPASGKPVPHCEAIDQQAERYERERALWLLGEYYGDFAAEANVPSILLGAHLAMSLRLKDAGRILRDIEQSEYAAMTLVRLACEPAAGVDPFSFRCFRARQLSRLALRRLGQETTTLPIYEFAFGDREVGYFRPKPPAHSVQAGFPLVKEGMTPEEVLNLIGSPDFVVGEAWEFDTAGDAPATLVVEWKDGCVSQTRKVKAKWNDGLTREQDMVMF
ncbi:MAG: hypothetical protein RBS80_00625 [Thermoguttaceae bacterium]|jgi:hypothetical protein|nr:hypothetical protein [Thermoguttaceae bacterium]